MKLVIGLIFVLLAVACGAQPASPETGAAAAVDEARAKYEESVAAGFAWRPARVALEAAEAALAAGDVDDALVQAQQARALAEASLAQAAREARLWSSRPPFGGAS